MILDATFLIDIARGDAEARAMAKRLAGQPTLIPSVVAAQVLAGSRNPEADLEAMTAAGQIVSFGIAEAIAAGSRAREALTAGRFPGWDDIFIAGTASAHDLPVLTRNPRHFEGVETVTY